MVGIVKRKTNVDIINLVDLYLRSTFFSFQGVIYDQVDGMAMGSPLSLLVANMYMEHFKDISLCSFPL